MSNIVYCDHSDDIIQLQNKGVTDINKQLNFMSEIEITENEYNGDDFINESLPIKGYKYSCPYCESLNMNPEIIFIIDINNPKSRENFVRLRQRNNGLVIEDSNTEDNIKPQKSVMFTHDIL